MTKAKFGQFSDPGISHSVGKKDLMRAERAFNDPPLYSQAHPNLRDSTYVRKNPRLARNIHTLGVGRTGHRSLKIGSPNGSHS